MNTVVRIGGAIRVGGFLEGGAGGGGAGGRAGEARRVGVGVRRKGFSAARGASIEFNF